MNPVLQAVLAGALIGLGLWAGFGALIPSAPHLGDALDLLDGKLPPAPTTSGRGVDRLGGPQRVVVRVGVPGSCLLYTSIVQPSSRRAVSSRRSAASRGGA